METSLLSLVTAWDIPLGVTSVLVAVSVVYVRGWAALRRTRPATLSHWRLISFLSGMLAVFVAVSSPLDTYSETLLFMHMAQHFILMSVAPPLIVLGSPVVPILRGVPRWVIRKLAAPLLRSSAMYRAREFVSSLPIAWLAMNLAYLGWHIPRAYEFALSSEGWHNVEHLSFFLTSIVFWWPVVLPWPARQQFDSWILIPYLLTSDLVNTGLSAFLCFSGRLLYPSYALVQRPFGIDALKDQITAGAFMWVFGSLVFVVPAMILTLRALVVGRLVLPNNQLEKVRALAH
jgi:cytochrome c oxidase assembly factor CtaG